MYIVHSVYIVCVCIGSKRSNHSISRYLFLKKNIIFNLHSYEYAIKIERWCDKCSECTWFQLLIDYICALKFIRQDFMFTFATCSNQMHLFAVFTLATMLVFVVLIVFHISFFLSQSTFVHFCTVFFCYQFALYIDYVRVWFVLGREKKHYDCNIFTLLTNCNAYPYCTRHLDTYVHIRYVLY